MKIKDIVSRHKVNLENCASEPIHIPGSIQPHGFLLGLGPAGQTIDFCSGNVEDFTRFRYEQLLGKRFESVFGEAPATLLNDYISSLDQSFAAPLEIELAGTVFTVTIQPGAGVHLAEFEPVVSENMAMSDIYQQTKQFTSYIQKVSTLQGLCQLVAVETKSLTGYDRVLIYRFDNDYNGEVIAESKNDGDEPFLGLHYPHTDIPAQARELYIKNLLRLIVNVDYVPVPIYTIDDAEGKVLDMSHSTLRSVSPIHVQYLKNMGVAATLTISLMFENRLWGLIACHHNSPKYISRGTRIAAQLQGHFLTSQISVRQLAEEFEVQKKVNQALDQLLDRVFSVESISLETLIVQQQLLTLTNAASVIILVDEKLYTYGSVPSEVEIKKLASWLNTYNSPTGFNTSNLASVYPDAAKWCPSCSGIISHSLGSGLNNCIIWCRPEALQEVHWAGNLLKNNPFPSKELTPRRSFELWKEIKKCESTAWEKPELIAAANFVNALQKHVHMMFLAKEELKQRKLSEKLKEANAELENLNWIGSHDLNEPLRKIQLFASRILDEDHSGNYAMIMNSVRKMSESANRMQLLISDILSYSRISHFEESFSKVSMNDIVKSVVEELSFELIDKQATVEYSDLPDVKGIAFLLQQIFSNLIRNSLKFSKPGVIPHITISPFEHTHYNDYYGIVVKDNGIGFDNLYKESIFKVFTRLHNANAYSGSGVGLALCRKIMKTHNGFMTAEGKAGTGAEFYLYFPKG
jgi:light-regulated signal transduction histidine kinase (bacteriophytochrome)